VEAQESLNPLIKLWWGPFLLAGGFTADCAKQAIDDEFKDCDNIITVFGRYFLSTPDLVLGSGMGSPSTCTIVIHSIKFAAQMDMQTTHFRTRVRRCRCINVLIMTELRKARQKNDGWNSLKGL